MRQLFSQKSQSVWLLSSKQGCFRLSRCPRLPQPVAILHRLLSVEGNPCKCITVIIAKLLTAAQESERVIHSVAKSLTLLLLYRTLPMSQLFDFCATLSRYFCSNELSNLSHSVGLLKCKWQNMLHMKCLVYCYNNFQTYFTLEGIPIIITEDKQTIKLYIIIYQLLLGIFCVTSIVFSLDKTGQRTGMSGRA